MLDTILVLCTGNICRSPMAEALLRSGFPGKSVSSAGIQGLTGHPADPLAIEMMKASGVDISEHVARKVTYELIINSELILVMDVPMKQDLERRYPMIRGRVFRLGEWLNVDIPDPYRKPREFFQQTYASIDACVSSWKNRI